MLSRLRRKEPAGSIEVTPGVSVRASMRPRIVASARCRCMRRGVVSSRWMPSRMICSVRSLSPRLADPAFLGGLAEVVDGEHAEIEPHLADRPWPEARDVEQLDEAWGDLGDELVVVGHPPGRGDLGDLVADRGADARILGASPAR